MDPKNGEISRAMRNRGVEIYIAGEVSFQSFPPFSPVPVPFP
jgi:midasin (ATPase involved in ribosome maturation)